MRSASSCRFGDNAASGSSRTEPLIRKTIVEQTPLTIRRAAAHAANVRRGVNDRWAVYAGSSSRRSISRGDVKEAFGTSSSRLLAASETEREGIGGVLGARLAYQIESFFVPAFGVEASRNRQRLSNVDLPDPFSPTKRVTLGCNSM